MTELRAALDELRAVKRLLFVEPRLAEGETRAGAVLRGLELAPVLRPSAASCGCAWHQVLPRGGVRPRAAAAARRARRRGRSSGVARSTGGDVAQLCGGDDFGAADSPETRRAREERAWLDVQRCLDAWATRASATGVSARRRDESAAERGGSCGFRPQNVFLNLKASCSLKLRRVDISQHRDLAVVSSTQDRRSTTTMPRVSSPKCCGNDDDLASWSV